MTQEKFQVDGGDMVMKHTCYAGEHAGPQLENSVLVL